MTVSSTTTSVSYTGDGSTDTFAVTFIFFGTTTTAEITVIERTIATGAEAVKTNGVDYTVSGGNGSTGTVTATTPPANTVEWHIHRVTTRTQGTDYVANDPFPAETHETALDRLTTVVQEDDDRYNRTPHFRKSDTYNGGEPHLPVQADRASKVLAFDANGDFVVSTEDLSDIEGAATSAAAAAASASAASSSASAAAASEAAALAAAAGIKWKNSAKAASTANLTLSGEQTVDGISLVTGDKALVKDQTANEENGLYTVASGSWTRDTTMDAWGEVPSAAVAVEEGTVNADTQWICTSDQGGTLDTTAITFAKLGSAQLFDGTEATVTPEGADLAAITDSSDSGNPKFATAQSIADLIKATANTFTKTQTWTKGADVASAASLTLGDGNYFDVTGTTAITSIATKGIGTVVKLHFDAALTLTHNATNLVLPGAANITTAAGDEFEFTEYAVGQWRCTGYALASGRAIVVAAVSAATQAQQEAASDNTVMVTPAVQQFHPSAAKAWQRCGVTGNNLANYNATGTTDTGTGQVTIGWDTDFSSASYSVVAGLHATTNVYPNISTENAGALVVDSRNSGTGALQDPLGYSVVAFGDQA